MAESLYWLGRLGVRWPLAEWLADVAFDAAVDTLSIELMGDVVLGMSEGYPEFFPTWMEANRPQVLMRFRRATRTVLVEDDGQKMVAHFLVQAESSPNSHSALDERIRSAKNRFHEEAIARVELMRRLFPDRDSYACQGYGHRMWLVDLNYDDTQKTGIPHDSLPPIWLTSVNSNFRGLAQQEFRPKTWQEYAQLVVELRQDVIAALRQLVRGLERYFRGRRVVQLVNELIDMGAWDSCTDRLNHPPLLPTCAVDEWGLLDESSSESATLEIRGRTALVSRKGLAIQPYRAFLDAFRDWPVHLWNFFQQSVHVMVLNPVLGRTAKDATARAMVIAKAKQEGIKENAFHLSTHNLAEAVKVVPRVQSEFRQLLAQFVAKKELDRLERQEEDLYRRVWDLWYLFETHPQHVVQNECELGTQVSNGLHELRRALNRECRKLSDANLSLQRVSDSLLFEGEPALWLTIDGQDAISTYIGVEKIVIALREAIRKMPDTPLRQYVLDFHWPYCVVLPLVRGKSLFGTAWRCHLPPLLASDALKWWQFLGYPISHEALATLKIATWEHPNLPPAQRLLTSAAALSLYAAHIGDFAHLPTLDEEGVAQVQDCLRQLAEPISQVLQSALDAHNDMCNIFNRLPAEERESRPYLLSALKTLVDLHAIILPAAESKGKMGMNMPAMAQWAGRLKEARETAWLVYLFWASDVIAKGDGKAES